MEILLDGYLINNKEQLFIFLKEQIDSDEFYGNNLDALWDVLSYQKINLKVTINNLDKLKENLGNYVDKLIKVFTDLEETGLKVEITTT